MNILVTKVLPIQLKQKLIAANFTVFEENFIAIQYLAFDSNKLAEFLIFTSQNAIESVIKNKNIASLKKIKCFCVGKKTKKKLEENGFRVVKQFDKAEFLANEIIENYAKNFFLFFSGNIRKDDLPSALQNAKIIFEEIVVYETNLAPKKIDTTFEAIAFFSPSTIESYLINNKIEQQVCFCIGTSTANALKHKTKNIIIASTPTIENVINDIITYYSK